MLPLRLDFDETFLVVRGPPRVCVDYRSLHRDVVEAPIPSPLAGSVRLWRIALLSRHRPHLSTCYVCAFGTPWRFEVE